VRARGALPLALAALALAGCDLTMTKQPKYGPQVKAGLFANGTSAQAPQEGTVSQGAVGDAEASAAPPPVTLALVERGQERFQIFCKPCHGVSGEGDGIIVARGFPRPPSYQVPPADRWAIISYIRALEIAHDQGAPDVRPPKGSSGGPA
jgi:mono/diheme cytochrome c family protein